MNKTIVVNFIAGPGCGKTTVAALIFSKLKIKGFNCEFVSEFAKTLIWTEQFEILNNQYYVSMHQYQLFKSIDGKVDIIITDGSLIHGLHYNKINKENTSDIEKTHNMILNRYHEFKNLNFILERGNFKYVQSGRQQNEQESKQIDGELINIMEKEKIPYYKCKFENDDDINIITDVIIKNIFV